MFKEIKPIDVPTNFYTKSFSCPMPKMCPVCNTAINAEILSSYYVHSENFYRIFVMYFCNFCEDCFLGVYYCESGNIVNEKALIPHSKNNTIFSDEIDNLSHNFVNIFHQSENAEQSGLDEICGIGYRKALEFLIKDYAIKYNPQEKLKIVSMPLANCIKAYIDNNHIKSLAIASAWLGNDETHYSRKHEDYNINHLKLFITSLVAFIDSELAFYKAQPLINPSE